MRDLATYVHFDALYEAYLNACLILLDLGARFDPAHPYTNSTVQTGFGTFGGPHILSLVTEVATRALKAVWFQKWYVHRRLRPEAMGGLIHNQLTSAGSYPLHAEILATGPGTIAVLVQAHNAAMTGGVGTFLLPMAFREGSPMHPCLWRGPRHGRWRLRNDPEGMVRRSSFSCCRAPRWSAIQAAPAWSRSRTRRLTVGGELNKVAANIAIGRNMAGVHWRTDYTKSVRLGEAVAIHLLEEQKLCYNEFSGLGLTRFDGTRITI